MWVEDCVCVFNCLLLFHNPGLCFEALSAGNTGGYRSRGDKGFTSMCCTYSGCNHPPSMFHVGFHSLSLIHCTLVSILQTHLSSADPGLFLSPLDTLSTCRSPHLAEAGAFSLKCTQIDKRLICILN